MWECKKCRESLEDTFVVCWKCGTSMEGIEDPSFRPEPDSRTASGAAHVGPEKMLDEPCSKCGSPRVIRNARLHDQGEHSDGVAKMVVFGKPSALIFKGREYSELVGDICCDCGNVELKCRGNLNNLWRAYCRAEKHQ